MSKKVSVIGRLQIDSQGNRYIVPLNHKEAVLAHQSALETLCRAARKWRDEQTTEALLELGRAAENIDV